MLSPQYRAYLQSDAWQKKRQEAFKAHGRKCAVCGITRRLQVHHLSYKNLGHEPTSDFRILCKKCHKQGRYSAWEIGRDHEAQLYANFIDKAFNGLLWLLWLPFRLAWKAFRYSPKSVD